MGQFFRLDGSGTTAVLHASSGPPEVIYLGRRLPPEVDPGSLRSHLERPWHHGTLDRPVPLSLLPETGVGFFGQPGIRVSRGGHELNTQLRLDRISTTRNSLDFSLEDPLAGIRLNIEVSLPYGGDILFLQTRLRNTGSPGLEILWLASGVWPVAPGCDTVTSFGGRWGHEFRNHRHRLAHGALVFENRRGRTSHATYPALLLSSLDCSSTRGEAICAALAWSGNHRCLAERLAEGPIQLQLGEGFAAGELVLDTGASYESPPALVTCSSEGFNPVRHAFHEYVRRSPIGRRPRQPRPLVHFNTWEACYFEHSEQNTLRLVREAATLGAERFVLDDGWMRDRTSDRCGLGDWRPCEKRYPNGLEPVVEAVEAAGMEFGLWLEPEMVTEDSPVYRQHPDWVLRDGSRDQPIGRNQYALALFRDEVFDHVLKAVLALIERYRPAYLKWDMNRDLTHCVEDGRPVYHLMTKAFHRLLQTLRDAAPDLEIEICASGGGRADLAAILAADRIWASDTLDPHDRQVIQKNISLFLPPEKMGCHVGNARSAVSGRHHSMAFRGLTAFPGHLGLELDPTRLGEEERQRLQQIIRQYKQHRSWMINGHSWYLDHPDPGLVAQIRVSRSRTQALLFCAQLNTPIDAIPSALKLDGLDSERTYAFTLLNSEDFQFMKASSGFHRGETIRGHGAALMAAGLQLPLQQADTCAVVFFEAC